MPTFSIITITYNAEKYIEKTIESIISQTDTDFEYILVDGNSKDSTMRLVKKYESNFSKIISEPDKGLYDAMNKGLKVATGKYVWFVNAGDLIAQNDTIEKLKQYLKSDSDVIYGETNFIDESGRILGIRSQLTPHHLPQNLDWKQMKYGMLVCHQSFIARREICPEYDISNLSADLDWEISVLKNAKQVVFYPEIISYYLIGGISNQQLKKSLKDRFKVLEKHFGFFPNLYHHVQIMLRGFTKIRKEKKKYW